MTKKWYKIIDDSIDTEEMSVLIYVEGKNNPLNFDMFEDKDGIYVNLYDDKLYILEPIE